MLARSVSNGICIVKRNSIAIREYLIRTGVCEKTGFTPDDLRGKLVLDAGVGAGRYADVISRWGTDVVGVDLSFAVEAAARNVGEPR